MRKDAMVSIALGLILFGLTSCTFNADTDTEEVPVTRESVLDMAAPGPYTGAIRELVSDYTFTEDDKLVATYYFYWYDVHTKAHIVNPDGSDALTTHPPTLEGFSWREVDWHKRQLLDMIEAGIDIVLPVYWGDSINISVSIPGLEVMVEAWQQLKNEGKNPPKIGMFYDTAALEHESKYKARHEKYDLTTQHGMECFYKCIRDFYSMIPPELRARIDNRPVVWLYSADFVGKYNQETFEFVNSSFQNDFNEKGVFLVKEVSWIGINADRTYKWMAAMHKPYFFDVISIGPGYDDLAVPGRMSPIRERLDGQYYRDSWEQTLVVSALGKSNIVVIETWNEYHEGTDIAESLEYGRTYIEITRDYVNKFKAGTMTEYIPGMEFLDTTSVSLTFDGHLFTRKRPYVFQTDTNERRAITYVGLEDEIRKDGIIYVEGEDGKNHIQEVAGYLCLSPKAIGGTYMYFQLNDFFKIGNLGTTSYRITIEYYDSGNFSFGLEYDSTDVFGGNFRGAYKPTNMVRVGNSRKWKEATFVLNDALFAGRQNNCADFRIVTGSSNLSIRKITVQVL